MAEENSFGNEEKLKLACPLDFKANFRTLGGNEGWQKWRWHCWNSGKLYHTSGYGQYGHGLNFDSTCQCGLPQELALRKTRSRALNTIFDLFPEQVWVNVYKGFFLEKPRAHAYIILSEPPEIPQIDRRMQLLAVSLSVVALVTVRFDSWKVWAIEKLKFTYQPLSLAKPLFFPLSDLE